MTSSTEQHREKERIRLREYRARIKLERDEPKENQEKNEPDQVKAKRTPSPRTHNAPSPLAIEVAHLRAEVQLLRSRLDALTVNPPSACSCHTDGHRRPEKVSPMPDQSRPLSAAPIAVEKATTVRLIRVHDGEEVSLAAMRKALAPSSQAKPVQPPTLTLVTDDPLDALTPADRDSLFAALDAAWNDPTVKRSLFRELVDDFDSAKLRAICEQHYPREPPVNRQAIAGVLARALASTAPVPALTLDTEHTLKPTLPT